jgi:hypothetical protein
LPQTTPVEVISYLRFDVAADVGYAVAAALAVGVIRRIEGRAQNRARAIAATEDRSALTFPAPPAKTSARGATIAVAAGVTALLAVGVFALVVLPTSSASQGASPVASQLPHEAANLEALLPSLVAGRPMKRWSLIGHDYFTSFGADTATIASAESDLKAAGLTLDDLAFAIDGRSSEADPPYLVFALRF